MFGRGMSKLRIHLLGGFQLDVEGRTLPPIPSAAGRSLLAYLVSHRDLRHTRDLLAGTFWPDRSESSARRRLSHALWQIQTALDEAPRGGSLLEVTHGTVAVATTADFWLDVAEFDRHLARADERAGGEQELLVELEAAVDLYRGEFLAGFYEDWTDFERQRLRSRYLGALERLVALHKARADYETALSYGRRITLHDPMREDAHREVMRLCFLLGRSNEALRQYDRIAALLAEELGTDPTAETIALRDHVAQMRDKGVRPFAPTASSPLIDAEQRIPLVGRRDQRMVALRRLEDVLTGRGGVVLIEGEAGVGKTRLIQELADDAAWRGLTVLSATCSEEEMLHPLRTLRTAIESGLTPLRAQQFAEILDDAEFADLANIAPAIRTWLPDVPEPAPLHPSERQDRLGHVVRQLMVAIGTLNATVLFVDDAQWSDLESLALLIEVAPALHERSILLCLAFRSDEARQRPELWQLLLGLDRHAQPDRLDLPPLTQSETALLVEESLESGAVAPDVAEGLFYETGGNPLFILETLRAWHDETHGVVALSGIGPIPPVSGGIAQVIARRLDTLDRETRRVLDAAAVSAAPLAPDVVARATGLRRLGVLQAVDDLLRRGLLVERHGQFDFAHHQVRRVVLDGIEPQRLRLLHHDIATATEALDPDRFEDLAYHYTRAEAPTEAMRFSVAAGEKALTLAAYDTAAQHFERAAGWGGVGSGQFRVLASWEEALDVLGRREQQRLVVDRMELTAQTGGELIEAARRRARLLGREGEFQEAIAVAEDALLVSAPPAATGALRRTLGLLLSRAGRSEEAVAHLTAAVAVLGGDPSAEADARTDLGNVLAALQRYDDARTELEAAISAYEKLGHRRGMAEAAGELAVLQMEQGDVAGAIERYELTLALTREIGYRRREGVALLNLGNALYVEGHLGAALDRYEEAAVVFSSIGDAEGEALVRANAAGVRHLLLDDADAERDLRHSLRFFRDSGHPWGEAFCLEHLGAIARRRGESDLARQHVEDGLKLLAGGKHRWVEVHLLRQAAGIELDAGQPDAAVPLLDQARHLCQELGLDDVLPTIETLASRAALEQGDGAEALRRSRTATELLTGDVEQPYLAWYTRYRAAIAVGEKSEAEESLSEASRLLDRIIDGLEPELAALARTVPEHRSIIEAGVKTWPTTIGARLPRADAPRGRPLRDDDWVDVTWTVTTPADYDVVDKVLRRRSQILRLVGEAHAQNAAPRIEDLADTLGVSGATLRRDIAALRRDGHRLDTRGSR